MKQKRQILILGIILIALAALYGGLRMWNKSSEEKTAEEAESEKIHMVSEKEFTAFSYSNGTDKMSFVKEGGVWLYEEDEEIPMSQSTIEGMLSSVSGITAVRKLDQPDALEDYGLTEPAYTVSLISEDGEESELYIGNVAGEDYYAMTDDTEDVYTITSDIISSLNFELSGLVQNDVVPSIGSGNLKKVEIIQAGETTVYEEQEDMDELAGGFGALTLSDCIDYHVQQEKLTDYGLDEINRITVNVIYKNSDSDEEETFTIYAGSVDESGENQYVMMEGSKMVYQVSKEVVENMMTVDTE